MRHCNQTRGPALNSGSIPFVIGVTGHRDLKLGDVPALKAEVRREIDAIQRRYPHTPLVVLSPLAEGADRLVAAIALECGAALIVPLPLPRLLYEQDFPSSASREEFRDLLSKAMRWFELPLAPGCTNEGISSPGPQRDLQYAQVGVYVARHSQMMIALWDGKPTTLGAGTAQVVQYRLRGVVPENLVGGHSLLDPEEMGPVIHVATPRLKDETVEDACPVFSQVLYPGNTSELADVRRVYEARWSCIERFNREAAHRPSAGPVQADATCGSTSGECGHAGQSRSGHVRALFAAADRLALAHQQVRSTSIRAILLAAVAGACALEFFHSFGSVLWHEAHWGWMAVAGFLVMVGGALLLWYVVLRRYDVQSRHLDYRALAEGLRVQIFWDEADIGEGVADHYLGKQAGELAWIRHAVRTCAAIMDGQDGRRAGREDAADARSRLLAVNAAWVKDQARYYAGRVLSKEHRAHAFRFISRALVLVAFLLVLPLLPVLVLAPNVLLEHALLCVCSICSVLAAALTAYQEVMAFEAESRQYWRMARVFERCGRLVDAALEKGDFNRSRELLIAVGEEALAEHGDWVLTHRARPLDLPDLG